MNNDSDKLKNENMDKTKEFEQIIFFLLTMNNENKFLNMFIKIINEIKENKQSLDFLRNEIVEQRDASREFLEIHKDELNHIITHFENKEKLSEFENDVLEELKEIK